MSSMKVEPLTQDNYKIYGDVIAARSEIIPSSANQGTAKRYNGLASIKNLRPVDASANICVFRSQAFTGNTFTAKLLEKHALSTQLFVPMNCKKRYLVLVATGNDKPDLSTLKAFIASPNQGITYHPGTWHHPLIALDSETDFACLVYEDGTRDDCKTCQLDRAISIELG